MAKKAPTGKDLATALCKKHGSATSKALARMLYDQNRERFTSFNAAYLAVRRVRGAQGDHNRKWCKPTVPREHGKPGWKPECPPSAAEPWNPLQIDGPARILILSDWHIPYHHKEACEAAVKFGVKFKPDVVLWNGDYQDFYRLSRWDKDPKRRDLVYEINVGAHGLSWVRGKFPRARFIYKMGNHEEWLTKYIWNKCPELYGLEGLELHNVLHFEDYGIERVNDNPIMAGKLPILHGHEVGRGIAAPVNPARGLFLRTLHTCLVGHHHRPSSHTEPDMFKSETTTWSTGCLCDMSPEYARVNKWRWGFACVEVANDNTFNIHNYAISNDYKVRTA